MSQTEIAVDGNSTVFGADPSQEMNTWLSWFAQPDFCETMGMNEQVSFGSGETWFVTFHGGEEGEDPFTQGSRMMISDENADCSSNPEHVPIPGEPGDNHWRPGANNQNSGPLNTINPHDGSNAPDINVGVLQQGDNVNVLWEAESGGKSQTLFKYTVQQTGGLT